LQENFAETAPKAQQEGKQRFSEESSERHLGVVAADGNRRGRS
jgi:hypothetical protein